MKFKGQLQSVRLNVKAFKKELKLLLSTAITEAAAAWLGAVTKIVPTWSGASTATFLPLAREAEYALTIQPDLFAKGNRVSLGLQNSSGSVDVDGVNGTAFFTYSTSLAHLIWNEFHNANIDPDPTKFPPPAVLHKPGPYQFQKAGAEKFESFAPSVMLPNPFRFLKIKPIRVR